MAGACMVPDPQVGQTLPSPQPNRAPLAANENLHYVSPTDPRVLDIFRPPATFTGPRPLIVYVHGGAWVFPGKDAIRCGGTAPTCTPPSSTPALAKQIDRGYVVASIDYRLVTLTSNRHPAQVEDVKLAIKWLKANATTYGIDPNQVVVAGHSAGGHLAALTALTPGLWEPTGVAATTVDGFMVLDGPTDLKTWAPWGDAQGAGREFIADTTAWLTNCDYTLPGQTCTAVDGAYDQASPLYYASAGDPPGYLTCKDWDPFVPCDQLELLHDKLVTVQGGVEQAAVFDDVNCTDPARVVPCGTEPTDLERHNPDWDLNLVGLQDWLDQVTN